MLSVIHDEIQSESNSGTQEDFLESTEHEIVDLVENSVDQIDNTKNHGQETDNEFQSEPLQLDPDEDRLKSSDLENDETQLLSAHDSKISEPEPMDEDIEVRQEFYSEQIEKQQQQELVEEETNDSEVTDEIVVETPQVDPIEINTLADPDLDDESESDSEQNVISVSTVKPNPMEPLEQNHTIDEVLTAVDKTQSDSQEAQPERTIVSDCVLSYH